MTSPAALTSLAKTQRIVSVDLTGQNPEVPNSVEDGSK